MNGLDWISVGLLGSLGALIRYLLDRGISQAAGSELPYGTFAINISGAFLLGLLSGFALSGTALVLAGTATLGSYTTFSTWMLETDRLREEGEFRRAAANVVLSLGAGVVAVVAGRAIGAGL